MLYFLLMKKRCQVKTLIELMLLFKRPISTESSILQEHQEVRYHEHEPKSRSLRDLTFRKKKDELSGRHGETAERFKADNQNNSIKRCTNPKSSGNGRNLRPSKRVGKY